MDKATIVVADLRVPDNDSVYPGRDGQKSVMAVTARVPLGPVTLDCALYARLTLDGTLSYDVSVPRKGIAVADQTKAAIREAVDTAVSEWSGWQAASERAERILTQPIGVSKAGKAASKLGVKKLTIPQADAGAAGAAPKGK